MTDRPNILFIMTDQQSFNMLSCAGNKWLNTPNLDRLAAKGIRFDNAYCSNPVCVPSRFSLFTGRMPSEIGLRQNSQHAGLTDHILGTGLGHLLKQAGYRALYGGKEHFPGYEAVDIGFELYEEDRRGALADSAARLLEQSTEDDRPFFQAVSFINPHDICYMAIRDCGENERERRMGSRGGPALEALDRALRLPDGISEEVFYRNHCPPLPDNHGYQENRPEAENRTVAGNFRENTARKWGEREWRLHSWAYHRLTEMVDAHIGTVLDAVERAGIADNTVIIFTSDHGDLNGAHKREHKTEFYDEASRVPLIIYDPAASCRGTVETALTSNGLDLVPTVCDYAGATVPEELKGMSLKSLVRDGTPESARESIPVENAHGNMIVTRDFKYAEHDAGANRIQLIDRINDPGEMHNPAADPRYAGAVGSLKPQFDHWFTAGKVPACP